MQPLCNRQVGSAMYLFQCDETNLEETELQRFFIYGGLIVPTVGVPLLTQRVEAIRSERGFAATDVLKFQGRSCPEQIDRDSWNAAKSEVIAACREVNARFLACVIFHQIAQREHLIEWQFDTVLDAFDRFLDVEDSYGLCSIDRFGNGADHALIRTKFTEGGTFASGWPRSRYKRITHFSVSSEGTSHVTSAADIVLGTFGFCVNQRGDSARPRELYPLIDPLIWRHPDSRTGPWGWGVRMRPQRSTHYEHEYRALRDHLDELANSEEGQRAVG
jgi:hypothetical protein